ncbi:hypothetical protein D9M69_275200 [compost metagenome]
MVLAQLVDLFGGKPQGLFFVQALHLPVEGLDIVGAALCLVAAEQRHCGSFCVRCR